MIKHIIKLSEANGGRFDPHQFHQERIEVIKKIHSTPEFCKLKDVVCNVKHITTELSTTDVYIGLENIESNTGDYIVTKEKETISSAGVFKNGDILFPKLRPYLNKVYLAEFDGKCSTEFHVFQARNINPEYLVIILRSNLILNQTKYLMTGNTLPRLQTSDIENLFIPFPSKKIQQQIVDLYNCALEEKNTKKQKATALLADIDNYLLKELGIELPENAGNERYFEVNIEDLIGGRLDVSSYRSRFDFTSNIFPSFCLSELLLINPSVKYEKLSGDEIISFVPMEVVDEHNGIIAEQRTTTVSKTKGFTKFKENDLIWAKITPCMQNGKSALARNLVNGYGCGSTEFYVLRPKTENILIEYVYFIMRDKRLLESAKNSFGGSAGQQRVSSTYLKSIKIPLPPKDIQQNIVEHIQSIRAKAKKLQEEAKEVLEQVKTEIEKMIIGE
jgi:type I restriction enzyme S subunit